MIQVVRVTREQRDAAGRQALRASGITMLPTPNQRRAMQIVAAARAATSSTTSQKSGEPGGAPTTA